VLREATLDDIPAGVRLAAIVNPEMIFSAAAFRHQWVTAPPEAQRKAWLVENGDGVVGWASAAVVTDTTEPGVCWAGVGVHPDHRRNGFGSALLEAVERHLLGVGGRRVVSWSRSDDDSAAFVRSHGYEQSASAEILVLDPRAVEPPDPPQGVELRPYAAFAADPRPLYEVDIAAWLDEPGDVRPDAVSYDYWLERFWHNPALDHDASTAALVDGVAVVTTMLQTDRETGRAQNSGTGTMPAYRGKGLATLAKRASLVRAAQLGCTEVYTGNDTTNAPMLAINRKLGYRPHGTELSWRKTFVAAGES
jgi:GNAT superfamily N-acetyltransferase